ncbi:glycosyltransferase family 4 protein [Porticoccaceae bacterium]|nr:glycosyltransferase family 4 protein [Porticoccaceae bacterium]
MKICFYTENYYKGGLDTFLINLINAWPDSDDELTLVCNGTHPGLVTIAEKVNRPVIIKRYYYFFTTMISQQRVALKWGFSTPVYAFFVIVRRFLQYPILFGWYLLRLTLFFRRSDFDRLMVVNGGYPASLLGRCAVIAWHLAGKKSKAIMNFHNSSTNSPWYFKFVEYLIDIWVINSVAQIVTVSRNCLNSLNERAAFRDCGKGTYILNGIDDPLIDPKVVNKLGSDTDLKVPYCLMLATYEQRKGHRYLLEAFALVVKHFPDIQLHIYGHGQAHERKLVEDEVTAFNLENHVQLNDFTEDKYGLIRGAKMLLVPSQSHESFGLTIIEAMAFGVPVVVTDVGGMPEVLLNSQAGYVCSKTDPVSFGDSIKNILSDSVLASNLGVNGRSTFEKKFVASIMARQYEKLVKN